MSSVPQPGSVVEVRCATWKVLDTNILRLGYREVHCERPFRDRSGQGGEDLSGTSKGTHRFFNPAAVRLVADISPGLIDTKLHLEAAFRHTPTTTRHPLTLGRAAIDDLTFQHLPVEKALAQDRVRLLIADDVGLGKTLEA